MKYNKGFIGVGVIMAIIAVLVVSGGVVYYATKTLAPSSNTEENNYQPQTNQNQEQTNTQTPPATITLDLPSFFTQKDQTILIEAFKKPANFNEHYVVAELGCGTGCFAFGVIDKNTGKVYLAPIGNDIGQFTGNIGQQYSLYSNKIKIITKNGSKINTYTFTGSSFSLLSSDDSQSSVSTLNLKTYTNTKYGFELKYPVNNGKGGIYKVVEFSNTDDAQFTPTSLSSVHDTVLINVPCNCDHGEYQPSFKVDVRGITSNINLDTYTKDKFLHTQGEIRYDSSEYVNINGVQWLKVKYLENFELNIGPTTFYIYVTTSNNKKYEMGLYGLNYSENDYKKLGLYDIIFTFKFTK